MKQWYDGYLFGKTEVYNPWSIINYVRDKRQEEITPLPYWSNTSGNSIIRSLLERIDEGGKAEIESLIAGGQIEKQIHEDMTYQEIYISTDNVWNFLYFTGYLTKVTERREGFTDYVTLRIPNDEIRSIFENQIKGWFGEIVAKDHKNLYQALLNGDAEELKRQINRILMASISYMDSLESFYHGMMVGILSGLKGYRIVSNRESGDGRADLLLMPNDLEQVGMVIEFKIAKNPSDIDLLCQEALDQIERNHYEEELRQNGCGIIYAYGIAFYKKYCKVICMVKE